MAIRFGLELTGMGWAALVFAQDRNERRVKVLYVHDTVGDIIRAMAAACAGVGKHEIAATDEMDDVLITIRRMEAEIEIIVKRRLERGWPVRYGEWKKLVSLRASTMAMVAAFFAGWNRTIEARGIEGYRETWGHEFPKEAWQSIREQVG